MLTINSLITWKTGEEVLKTERVLWVDVQQKYLFAININSSQFPVRHMLSDIENSLKIGEAFLEEIDCNIRIINEEDIADRDKLIRDKAWKVICNIVECEPDIYESKQRGILIKKASECHGVHENTIVKYLKKYWQRGKVKNALLPDFYKCGGKGKEKTGDVKRGRPRKNGDTLGKGINVDESIKRIFKTSINKFYNTKNKNSLAVAYMLMCKEFFSNDFKFEDGVKKSVLKPQNEIPSLCQFRYWFLKERQKDFKREVISRKSAKKYEQENRPILGNSTYEAIGPCSLYQIDATVADIYLVSGFNRQWIIGRPVIYAVIDVFSRMIAGINVGLEGPSWIGAMEALANAASNKVRYCEEYDIEIEEEEWPVYHLPDAIIADRGEMEGKNIENLVNALNVKILNTPPYRADWKGIIEQHFHVINQYVKPFSPGVIDPDTRERGDRDYRLDAKLDLREFTKIIIKCALYHNNHHYLKNYSKEEMMIEDDIRCIPIELWNWGIKNRSGKLRQVAENLVKLNLMPSDTATVTSKGIKYKKLFYSSNEAIKENWFEKARNKGSWRIQICYDPRNLNYIYYKKDNGTNYEKCFLLEYQNKYFDKSVEEVNYLIQKEEIELKQETSNELQAKVDLISEINNIVNEAKKDTEGEDNYNPSNRKRIKGIRNNRKLEIMANREKEAFELGDMTYDKAKGLSQKLSTDDSADEQNEITLLKKKQREAVKNRYE